MTDRPPHSHVERWASGASQEVPCDNPACELPDVREIRPQGEKERNRRLKQMREKK